MRLLHRCYTVGTAKSGPSPAGSLRVAPIGVTPGCLARPGLGQMNCHTYFNHVFLSD